MLTNSTVRLSDDWRTWPPEAKQRLLEKLRARASTSLNLLPLHPAQKQIKDEAKRFNVLACGRRFGKTLLGIELAADMAVKGYPVGWFAPTYKLLDEAWRDAINMLADAITQKNVQQKRLEFNQGSLEMWSLDSSDSARGRKYKRVIIDEAAMIPNFEDAWHGAIRPTLMDYEGDAFWLSTPKGMNFFKRGFDYGQDPSKEDWASWSFPSSANPYMPPKEIEDARANEPELWFKQEWLAEFLQNEGAVFRNVEANLKARETTPAEHEGHKIVQGIDWAQKHDFTAICTFCATCKREVDLDRFKQIEWSLQRGRLRTLYDRWKVSYALAEENSIGSPNIEALQHEGLKVKPFTTTAATKPPLIQSLALAFERCEASWLNIPVATAELVAYEAKISTVTGRPTYGAPEGMHDDTVIARALAWESIANPPRRIRMM